MVAEGAGGVTVACGTGMMRALLPCEDAWPRGSLEIVNTTVALQLESKTRVSVVVVVVVLTHFSAGISQSLLLLLPAGAVVRRCEPPCRTIYLRRPPPCSETHFSPSFRSQSEELQHPRQNGYSNASAKRSNAKSRYLHSGYHKTKHESVRMGVRGAKQWVRSRRGRRGWRGQRHGNIVDLARIRGFVHRDVEVQGKIQTRML